jgi:hypothetical protein
MSYVNMEPMEQALSLAKLIRNDKKWSSPLIYWYWGFAFRATRFYEKYVLQTPKNNGNNVLNFGCGNRFYENSVNSDLLAPHRHLKGKRRPDLYWSGTTELKTLQGFFNGIVCEHVIEHILPDDVLGLFSNFIGALKPGGTMVVTFPDIRRVLTSNACQGFTSSTTAANSVIYRHGHRFMYDPEIVCEMLRSVGFKEVNVATLNEIPLKQFLDPGREVETSYVIARKI